MTRSNIYQLDKIPYLLTILIALSGWTLNHLVDRLLLSPIIEYSEHTDTCPKQVSYTFRNLSRDKVFSDLTLHFLIREKREGEFVTDQCKVLNIPPSYRRDEPVKTKDSFSIGLPEFHPGWLIIIQLTLSENVKPTLHFSTVKDGNQEIEPVLLMEAGLETFLVKNEFQIMILLLGLWIILIIIYFIYLHRAKTPKSARKEPL
jgi:hypothetical protein